MRATTEGDKIAWQRRLHAWRWSLGREVVDRIAIAIFLKGSGGDSKIRGPLHARRPSEYMRERKANPFTEHIGVADVVRRVAKSSSTGIRAAGQWLPSAHSYLDRELSSG